MNRRPASRPALQLEDQQAAEAAVEVGAGAPSLLARMQRRIDDAGDGGVIDKKFRHLPGVLAQRVDAQRQRLDPLQDRGDEQASGTELVAPGLRLIVVLLGRSSAIEVWWPPDYIDSPRRWCRIRSVQSGWRSGCAAQSKLPLSMIRPPIEFPCPPRYFVAE